MDVAEAAASRGSAQDSELLERQPTLREQLSALTPQQMETRLQSAFAVTPRRPAPGEETVMGFKKRRKEELLDALCQAYASADAPPRVYRCLTGAPLQSELLEPLLEQLRLVDWSQNTRPGVQSSGYITLKQPPPLKPPRNPAFPAPVWPANDPRLVSRRVWDAAAAVLASVPEASQFEYTCLALSKNFVSSPHTDRNDLSVQYLLSLGDFENGGELCIEEDPFLVSAITTRERLAKCDGRFPHWVSRYEGERYSVVYFRSMGSLDPPTRAVHLPLS